MILYFSGTGNSKYVARRIADVTGDELVSIHDRIRRRESGGLETDERLVFVVPTYAWRIPKVVEQWIRETEFRQAAKAWFVMTCGDEIGNAPKYIRKLCAEKHFTYMGTGQVVMPENYIAMFAVPKPSTAQKIIRNAEPAICEIADRIAQEQPISDGRISILDRMKSSVANPAFYKLFVKADAFYAEDSCTGCGLCEKNCPLHNVKLQEQKPVWGKDCTHCMACISYCPAQAIEYGNKSKGKPRYRCEL